MKVIVNDILLNHVESGHPHGVPVVFIHGFPMNHFMWESQMESLPNDYRIIAYDVRGLGKSDLGNGEISMETHVDDLKGLLDDLDIKKAVVCGLSMGGYIALNAIQKFPQRFLGLILCDTKSEADTEEGKQKRFESIQKIERDGLPSFAEGFLKNVLAERTFQENKQIVNFLTHKILENNVEGIKAAQRMMAKRPDTTDGLKKIKVPTLVLVGEKDLVTPLANAESLTSKIPNSRMEVVPRAAHFSNIENPEYFNIKIQEFLRQFVKKQPE
jgi:3-oxoadipate enol-lactonase